MANVRRLKVVSMNGKLAKQKKEKVNKTIHFSLIKVVLIIILIGFSIKTIKDNSQLWNGGISSVTVNASDIIATKEDNIAATANVMTYTKSGSYTSSGVVLSTTSPAGVIVITAKHGVHVGENSYTEVTFIDGHTYQSDHIYYNKTNDWAIVTIDLDKMSSNTLNVIKTVKYNSAVEYKQGDNVYCIGQHHSDGLLYYEGEINSPDINSFLGKLDNSLYDLTTNFYCKTGTSGGGIYNEQGVILGICVSGTDEYTRFIPIYEILKICGESNYL